MKNVITNWHAVAILAALVIVPVAGKLLGLSNELTGYITVGVVSLATASGFINAADASTLSDTAATLSAQATAGITNVKSDLVQLHAISTANVAAVHTAVAVQAAQVGAPPPGPLIPSVPASDLAHDVAVARSMSEVQNKSVKL